ncbi:MAG TPA: hypothetical protein PKM50_02755 [Methanoregula sp.]|nr:hypothetical protein [Methanoregula sp.]
MKGYPAASLNDDVKICAEQMGYHWAENADPDLKYAGLMYRENVMIAVSAKKIRYGLDTDCIIENKFPDEITNFRMLPLPPFVIREFWVRTQNERAFRRFYILPKTTAEIEENTKEGYRNTHYREMYWKKAPYRIEITRPHRDVPGGTEGNDSQKTP